MLPRVLCVMQKLIIKLLLETKAVPLSVIKSLLIHIRFFRISSKIRPSVAFCLRLFD